MHYGYIGLGNLGAACAGCLVKAGFKVTVYDLNPKLAEPLVAMGATLAKSAEDLAGAVDHVITCLPSPAVSEAVLREMLPRMKPGASWVENSTLGRDDILRLLFMCCHPKLPPPQQIACRPPPKARTLPGPTSPRTD